MKHILIPTDLSVKSLQVVHEVVKRHNQELLQIHVVHMVHIPLDIMDLMFFRKSSLYDQVPAEFTEAMQLLKNKYQSDIFYLNLEFYYGNYAGALNTVIENLKIEEVYLLNNHRYTLPMRNSVNLISFLKRSKVPVYRLQPQTSRVIYNEHLLSSLFIDENNNLVQTGAPSHFN